MHLSDYLAHKRPKQQISIKDTSIELSILPSHLNQEIFDYSRFPNYSTTPGSLRFSEDSHQLDQNQTLGKCLSADSLERIFSTDFVRPHASEVYLF